MKQTVCLVLIVFALLFVGALPAYADGHGHGGHGHGHVFFGGNVWIGPGWGGWGPLWWGAPYYPYYPYSYNQYPYYSSQQSSEYVEQTPQVEEETYWYFCPDAKNYYPYVKRCPSGWLKVIPPSAPQEGSE